MTTIASKNQQFFLRLLCLNLMCPFAVFADGADNFNDNSKDTSKWGTDVMLALGVLTERNQRLEFTCNNPLSNDDTLRPWKLERFPVNADWTVQVDVFNNTAPSLDFQVNAAGIRLISPHSASTEIDLELYASSLGGPNSVRKGFDADMEVDDVKIGDADTGGLVGAATVNGAMRIEYTGATRVATFFYDLDISDGYQWRFIASYGLAGTGGATTNADWGLLDTDQLTCYVWGYSDGMTISSGQIYLDNFLETGGATPSGGPSPEPVGSFQFRFPTNNPLLVRMVSITGNYQGVSPTVFQRNYNLDVAQDESGKLTTLGTMDGILDKDGNAQISAGSGTVRTVDGEPTAKIKGSFKGTRDGVSTSFSGKAAAPVEVVDVGGGTMGLSGTGSYSSKVGGVPFSGRNLPVPVAAPAGAVDNLQQDWSLQLDLSKKLVRTKERTVASAQLLLPNGDTIAYRERVVRYSAKRGYSLSFTRGTNVTLNPAKIDKKSSISIKRLLFSQQGTDWQPTNGVLTYKFLGQKGTGNLLDFLAP